MALEMQIMISLLSQAKEAIADKVKVDIFIWADFVCGY
jgi:hypothetical protein